MAETDPNPGPDPATGKLRRLHRTTGELIALHHARNAPRILLAGDIEVPLPQNVKEKVEARIVAKTIEIAAIIADVQNGG